MSYVEPAIIEIWEKQVKDYSIEELEDWFTRPKKDVTPLWRKMVKKEYEKRTRKTKEKVRFD